MARIRLARTARLAPVLVVAALALAIAPAAASAEDGTAAYTPQLAPAAAPTVKVAAPAVVAPTALVTAAPKVAAPTAVAAPAATTSVRRTTSAVSGTATRVRSGGELSQARAILAGLIAQHPILAGCTVTIGDARGYQAIALYQSGRIIISPTHTASLSRILNHEVWHVIDWRDNGRIDWGENVPPRQ